ncbi:hypothetical protein L873DRAFT_1670829, partial [Choiromyces venosus 120613-1]
KEARLVYASHSITEVLGYNCQEIVGRSCFEYFHPDERPFAQSVHGRGVELDKAAVLSYCRLRTADGNYVTCECVFTVVHSVIVASTSLYRATSRSQGRALAAPAIRRAFSASPADPRFHMLTHLSDKFKAPPPGSHEPRAALILNRFTKTSSILYASSALNGLLGVELDNSVGISFYECIQRECLEDAIQAIEQAKENDSIAYLRFIWRNPGEGPDGRDSTYGEGDNDAAANGNGNGRAHHQQQRIQSSVGPALVMEAVVSCTSDGLVVVLRKARPIIPTPENLEQPVGHFVSPWSTAASDSRRRTADEMDAPSSILVPRLSGPTAAGFMDSIRQVAVFAWSLRSINQGLLQYARPPGLVEGAQPASIPEVLQDDPAEDGDGCGEKQTKRLKASHDETGTVESDDDDDDDDDGEERDDEVGEAREENRGRQRHAKVDGEIDSTTAAAPAANDNNHRDADGLDENHEFPKGQHQQRGGRSV